MTQYGLLIDYEYCSNCHSCEVTCKESHNYPVGSWGIKVHAEGPWEYPDGDGYNYDFVPVPTDLCDLCAGRRAKGKEPLCVHHCLANVITFGTTEELVAKMQTKNKQVLWVPQYKPKQAKGEFVPKKRENVHSFAIDGEIEMNANQTNSVERRSD